MTRPGVAARLARLPSAAVYAASDAVLVVVAYATVLVLRFDGTVPSVYWRNLRTWLPLAVALHLGSNFALRLYRSLWRFVSVQEARRVLLAGAASTAVMLAFTWMAGSRLPVSVVLGGGVLATLLGGVSRFRARLFAFSRAPSPRGLRVVVIGAGEGGAAIVRSMVEEAGRLSPVAVLDDDRRTWRRELHGIGVRGGIDRTVETVRELDADQVLLAIPSADGDLVRRVANAADEAGVPLKIVPSVSELVDGRLTIHDVRDLEIDDLLGRPQVHADLSSARDTLTGRVVLITGAGGSIGSEIARQVASYAPAGLVLLDHDETHLHDIASMLRGPAEQVLADIRDADAMAEVFRDVRPDVVFHAAALKHVPILEDYPWEAVRTNVTGTRNVLAATRRFGGKRFVLISTDKAVNPSSVMGASKWMAERLVRVESGPELTACVVRFGNVLGSRGSVTPTFMRQIRAGGPVTVTDPRMTRFFMSIEEAVELVLLASTMAQRNDVLMLDMGEPVGILELAEKMIRLSGRRVGADIELRVTGIRPGEKLHEELHAPNEDMEVTAHPSILRLHPPEVSAGELARTVAHLEELARRRRADVASVLVDLANTGTNVTGSTQEVIDLRTKSSPYVAARA